MRQKICANCNKSSTYFDTRTPHNDKVCISWPVYPPGPKVLPPSSIRSTLGRESSDHIEADGDSGQRKSSGWVVAKLFR